MMNTFEEKRRIHTESLFIGYNVQGVLSYASSIRYVFNFLWKLSEDTQDLMSNGRAFHNRGAVTEKDLSPQLLLVRTSWYWLTLPERRPYLDIFLSSRSSSRYTGILFSLSLKTSDKILYLSLCLTGNQ